MTFCGGEMKTMGKEWQDFSLICPSRRERGHFRVGHFGFIRNKCFIFSCIISATRNSFFRTIAGIWQVDCGNGSGVCFVAVA
jgi:hypothetical protein